MLEQSVPEGLHPMEGPMLEQKDCLLLEGPPCARGNCEVSYPAEEPVVEAMCDELPSPATLGRRRQRSGINKVKTRKKRGIEGISISYYHNLIRFGISSVKFLKPCLFYPWW